LVRVDGGGALELILLELILKDEAAA